MRFSRELRHAVRRLLLARGFAIAATLTLTLGIAAIGTVFSVVYAVLLRPLPYPAPDRLVSVSHTLVAGRTLQVDQTDASLLFFQRHNRAFVHFGGYRPVAAALAPSNGADAERVAAALVTSGTLPALRIAPLRGRTFTSDDDRPDATPVVVISRALWQRKFGGDPAFVGRTIGVDGISHEVIGIMPETFRFPTADTELWLPMRLNPAQTDSASFDYQAVARLRDGVSIEAAAQDLQALLPKLPDEFPGRLTRAAIEQTNMRVSVTALADVIVGDIGRLLWVIFAVSALVLAVASANVANLFLARAEGRRNAVAIEKALGAGAGDVLLQFLLEGLLVAVVAGVAAAGITTIAVQALRSFGGVVDLPRMAELRVDATVLGVTAAVALAATLLASAIPALRLSLGAPFVLGSRSPGTVTSTRHRARHALVMAQVALALVLLVGSGLMARSVWRLRAVSPGFDPANVTTFRVALPPAAYSGAGEAAAFFTRAVQRIGSLPGVQVAGAASKLPLDVQGRVDSAVLLPDRPIGPGSLPGIHPVVYATADYFAAARIPFVAGRTFTSSHPPRVVLEAVVSRALARRYWKGESPLGKRVRILMNGPWYTVVGEVGDVRDAGLDRPADALLYVPLLPPAEDRRWSPRDLALVVRTGSSGAITGELRDALRSLDPSLPLYRVRALSDVVRQASARREIAFVMIAAGAVVSVLLGAIGLYGVMSYVVALRTREIAIRLALGARPAAARRMVAVQALRVAAAGIAIGLGGAAALTRFLSALLFEVSPTDPEILVSAATVLFFVAAAASWLPTRRTASIDPASALKAE